MKKKNIILASVIVLFIFIVTVIIWFNANSANVNTKSAEESVSDAQNLQEGSTAPAEAGDNGAAEEGEVKKKEVKVLSAEEIEEENLKAMAANFVERWGSWSTDGDYSNFNSLKVQMTEEMRKFNEENKLEIRNLKLEIGRDGFYGITTKALSASIKAPQSLAETAAGVAGGSVTVNVIVQKSINEKGAVNVLYDEVEVGMVKEGEEWKVGKINF